MRIPLSWLREYVPVQVPTDELAERLALSTLEVDRVLRLGVPDEDGNLDLYRVGLVVEAGKHPNADRLQLCRVDVGRVSRVRSCAAPGTSARAPPSRSRSPAPSFPAGRSSSARSCAARPPTG